MTPPMTDEAAALQIQQIKHLVNRFLSWRLPQDFAPDAGISYTRPNYHPSVDATPTGTNLLDAEQAEGMVRHMLEGMPTPPIRPGIAGVLVEALEHIADFRKTESESEDGETGWIYDQGFNNAGLAAAGIARTALAAPRARGGGGSLPEP